MQENRLEATPIVDLAHRVPILLVSYRAPFESRNKIKIFVVYDSFLSLREVD